MLFNTWIFWLFFAAVLPLYWCLPHRSQNRMLLVASYVFYGCWSIRCLPLIIGSTLMDFYLGNAVASANSARARKFCLTVSVTVNLLLLGIFKYYDFFAGELMALAHGMGVPVSLPVLHLILPVGISFYTFQSMAYIFDIYRGNSEPAKNILDFALYIAFFPHLVAGPIMRSGTLLKQVLNARVYRNGDFQAGLYFILLGLFRKVVIGDNLAVLANSVFSRDISRLSGAEALIGLYAFAFQIYCDFSGYSSIAQGLARWMGFDLMTNFRMPYFAVSPSDFWQRWHISLSSWLRDYVYIGLGGNRAAPFRVCCNLLVTMLLGGIWHGANWTFILWGLYQGLVLCAYRILGLEFGTVKLSAGRRIVRIAVMFHVTCLGWLFFRAASVRQAFEFLSAIVTRPGLSFVALSGAVLVLFYTVPLLLLDWWLERRNDLLALTTAPWLSRALVYAYACGMLILLPPPVAHEFIYFQF